jgi:hypothetical protein
MSRWVPQVALSDGGLPVFSLTLLLGGPAAGPPVSWPIMDGSVLEAQFTLALRTSDDPATRRMPAIEQVTFDIVHDMGPLPGARVIATGGVASMRVVLDAANARAVLAAIDDPQSNLRVTVDVTYAADPVVQRVRMSGWWSAIYDALQPAFGGEGTVSYAALRDEFEAMLRRGTIAVMGRDADVDALFRTFVNASAIILRRVTPKLKAHDPRNRYALMRRPSRVSLNMTVDSPLTQRETVTLSAPLGALAGRALAGHDRTRFIRPIDIVAAPGAIAEGLTSGPLGPR